MNEFSAAFGLLQLRQIDEQIEKSKAIEFEYSKELKVIPSIRCHLVSPSMKHDYSYFLSFYEKLLPLLT